MRTQRRETPRNRNYCQLSHIPFKPGALVVVNAGVGHGYPALVFNAEASIGKRGCFCHIARMLTMGACILRENTGTSGLERTLRSAVEMLADHKINRYER